MVINVCHLLWSVRRIFEGLFHLIMNRKRDRDEDGKFESEYSDEDIINAVRKHEPAATSEVAETLGMARQSADYRLRRLLEENRVSKKKVGNSLIWLVEE